MKSLLARLVLCALIMTALMVLVFRALDYPTTGIDDANIFLVQGKNLAAGHGFVFNVGGERVEGFTSLLWVLLVAAVYTVTERVELPLIAVNVVLLSVNVSLVMEYLARMSADRGSRWPVRSSWVSGLVFLILVAASPEFVTWMTIALMEGALWGLLLTSLALAVLSIRDTRGSFLRLSLIVGAMLLARPEAMLWCPVAIGCAALAVRLHTGRAPDPRNPAIAIGIYALVLASLSVFRLLYFGFLLPNTFYAKVSSSLGYRLTEGLAYLLDYIRSGILIQAVVGCVLLFLVLSGVRAANLIRRGPPAEADRPATDERPLVLPILCLVGLITPILVGGDHFAGFRFYQPLYPLLVLNGMLCLACIGRTIALGTAVERVPVVLRSLGILALLAIPFWGRTVSWLNLEHTFRIEHEFRIAFNGRVVGTVMTRFFSLLEHYPSVAVITVGGIKYGYEGPVVDLMGLTNVRMGHSAGDRTGISGHAAFHEDTFYDLQPDLVADANWSLRCEEDSRKIHDQATQPGTWPDRMLHGLLRDGRFRSRYYFARIAPRIDPARACLSGFFRREFLRNIVDSNLYSVRILDGPADDEKNPRPDRKLFGAPGFLDRRADPPALP